MEGSKYLDFDLSIERMGENAYRARVLASPAGLAKAEFSMPLSPMEIENFVLKVGRMRRTVRRIESPEMQAAKDFGSKLYKAVFTDEVQSALRSSLDQARAQGSGLRIRLRLNDAPELVDIPWEYLYNPSLNRFLALSVNTPVVRYLELPESIQPLSVKPPLRVLVMISNPTDYQGLDVESEWQNLKNAVSDLEEKGLLILERLEAATPVALQYRLRREDFHIFHFIGHGGFDENAQDGLLMLENENGLGKPLSGQYLGTILHDEDSLRLVILNACEGARTGRNDPFAGVAQSLVQQGLPAVIAMQFEVSDQAAISFAHEFYAALADGLPVDASLSEARKIIFSSGNEVEWGTPVLYLRAPDGQIFDIVHKASALREKKIKPSESIIPAAISSHTEAENKPAVRNWQVQQEARVLPSAPNRQVKQEAVMNPPVTHPQVKPGVNHALAAVISKIHVDWRAFFVVALGVWIGWALFILWFDMYLYEGPSFALLFGAASGLFISLGMNVATRLLGFRLNTKQIAMNFLAWIGGMGMSVLITGYLVRESVDTSDILLITTLVIILFTLSVLPGTMTGVAGLQRDSSNYPWAIVWRLLLGWLIGLGITFSLLIQYNNNVDFDSPVVLYLGGGLAALIVGMWTQQTLRKSKKF